MRRNRDDEPELVLPLPEKRSWAELTTLPRDVAIDVRADVIAGRRPISELPDWDAAKGGDQAALDRINATVRMRKELADMAPRRPRPHLGWA